MSRVAALVREVSAAPGGACVYDDGDVAWMLVASVLVLSVLPGMALYRAGVLRLKNSVSILTQTLGGSAALTVLWFVIGFSLSYGEDQGGVIGHVNKALFMNTSYDGCFVGHSSVASHVSRVPEAVVAVFEMMPSCVTPMLAVGAAAERINFPPLMVFTFLWTLLVYYPFMHWMHRGWLDAMLVKDYAGGLAVHVTAGASALVIALFLGRRTGYDECNGSFPQSDLRMAGVGAAFMLTGFFGFASGSALGANTSAVYAVINVQISVTVASVIFLGWSIIRGRPSSLELVRGMQVGIAAIAAGAGLMNASSAFVVSIIASVLARAAIYMLRRLRIDDALDVFSVHGVPAAIGTLALGFTASHDINSYVPNGLVYGGAVSMLGMQALGSVIAMAYPAVITILLLLIINRISPLRVQKEHETAGLDRVHHGEDVVRLDVRRSLVSMGTSSLNNTTLSSSTGVAAIELRKRASEAAIGAIIAGGAAPAPAPASASASASAAAATSPVVSPSSRRSPSRVVSSPGAGVRAAASVASPVRRRSAVGMSGAVHGDSVSASDL